MLPFKTKKIWKSFITLLQVALVLLSTSQDKYCEAFTIPRASGHTGRSRVDLQLHHSNSNLPEKPVACLVGYVSPDQKGELEHILSKAGYALQGEDATFEEQAGSLNVPVLKYKYVKATAMLKLVEEEHMYENGLLDGMEVPRYIPVQSGEENVLVANGWSFLDPDESEPISSFDIDAANAEGQYKPKWGVVEEEGVNANWEERIHQELQLSDLGFNLRRMESNEIILEAEGISSLSRSVLLEGGTDEPNIKITNNEIDFSGSVSDLDPGIFVCAIGGNPLFTTNDLSPLTGSSGWLSFARPISEKHIEFVYAEKDAFDQRLEVVDSKTGCHLGHYFGADGYCINASALNFFPLNGNEESHWKTATNPVSWNTLRNPMVELSVSERIVKGVLDQNVQSQKVLFGAGCFWHVEYALRRLPGVIDTRVGYAGGTYPNPSYEDVCNKDTSHAEVVEVTFDPSVCEPRRLMDCFLAMHDPTMVRAHGKRAQGSGQYRSCIFTPDSEMEHIALEAVTECIIQLAKMLSTEVRTMDSNDFWVAEDRHQLHDERVKNKEGDDIKTLSSFDWLVEYGRRSSSIWGSSETLQVAMDDSDEDDGMARMMI